MRKMVALLLIAVLAGAVSAVAAYRYASTAHARAGAANADDSDFATGF